MPDVDARVEVPVDQLLPAVQRHPEVLGDTGMRVHEIALQAWCYRNFLVAEGYPVPVVYAWPMDAYGEFNKLWKSPSNPFQYLTEIKDRSGSPAYEPYPVNAKYPLICISRLGWQPRLNQCYGTRTDRRLAYVAIDKESKLNDTAMVVQAQHPNAWDFRFQLEHHCMRPDTQALFISKLMAAFPSMAGSVQTWISCRYPGPFGKRQKYCRMVLESGIDAPQPDEGGGGATVYRTSITLKIEGWVPDLSLEVHPTLWFLRQGTGPVSREDLAQAYPLELPRPIDLRDSGENPVFRTLTDQPPD